MDPQAERVVVAEILRPRGNRGELAARSQTDVPGRLESLRQAHVRLVSGSDIPVEIAESWPHKQDWVLKFAGIDSIDSAEQFRGADLWIRPEERGSLDGGQFFQADLMGCRVADDSTGEQLGVVAGWQAYGGPPLMEVQIENRLVLIPFVPPICVKVDLEAKTVRVQLPEGLLDL